jgi:hypothetical protein
MRNHTAAEGSMWGEYARLRTPNPTSPRPIRRAVEGSGTGLTNQWPMNGVRDPAETPFGASTVHWLFR